MKSSSLLKAAAALVLLAASLHAGIFIEKQETFIRSTGKPQKETAEFQVYNPDVPFYIVITKAVFAQTVQHI